MIFITLRDDGCRVARQTPFLWKFIINNIRKVYKHTSIFNYTESQALPQFAYFHILIKIFYRNCKRVENKKAGKNNSKIHSFIIWQRSLCDSFSSETPFIFFFSFSFASLSSFFLRRYNVPMHSHILSWQIKTNGNAVFDLHYMRIS